MEAFRLFLFSLAALTSIGCTWLLFRGYLRSSVRLLLWTAPPGGTLPPLASFFGFRSRTLIDVLVSFLCAIFFPSYLFGLFVLCCVGDTER